VKAVKTTLQKAETTVMKITRISTILRSALLASVVATGLIAPTANAQMDTSYGLKVRIPFAFQAGTQQMPAGLYRISFKSNNQMVFQVYLQNSDSGKYVHTNIMATALNGGTTFHSDGRLVFRRYGDQYFLHDVWQADSADGVSCLTTKEEKALAHSEKAQNAQRMQVAINAEPSR
jgi:hypothetical protein